MFDWLFPPVRPIDPIGAAWVEGRLRWLSAQFGDEAFLGRPPLEPTPVAFPELRGGTLQSLYERVCGHLCVDPGRVPLEIGPAKRDAGFVDDHGREVSGTAAHYRIDEDGERIEIDAAGIGDPLALIGTLAHELSHARLLGEGRLEGTELDHELSTDLCAVHHGFGLFLANSPRAWPADCSKWPGTELVMPGYMTAHMYAWALALRARRAGETKPVWTAWLLREPRLLFRESLRWLESRRDSAYDTGDWSRWDELESALEVERVERLVCGDDPSH